MAKLNKTYVDSLKPKSAKDYEEPCSALPGFVVRVHRTGRKTFMVRYREGHGRRGRSRRYKIGTYGATLTATQARALAKIALGAAAAGGDPGEAVAEHAGALDPRRTARRVQRRTTVADYFDLFMTEYAEVHCRTSTVRGWRHLLKKHILPRMGDLAIERVTRADVERVHREIGLVHKDGTPLPGPVYASPGAANRVLSLLSVVLQHAAGQGIISASPVRACSSKRPKPGAIRKFPGNDVGRALTTGEAIRLDAVLRNADGKRPREQGHIHPNVVAAIRFLWWTGCRRGEMTSVRWSDVDWERGAITFHDAKEARPGERPKVIHVADRVLELLRAIGPRDPGRLIFPAPTSPTLSIVSALSNEWRRKVKPWAELGGDATTTAFRVHDFRHNFTTASRMAGNTSSDVRRQTGHRTERMHEHYYHPTDAAKREVANRAVSKLIGFQRLPRTNSRQEKKQ